MKPGVILQFHALTAQHRVESREGTVVVPWASDPQRQTSCINSFNSFATQRSPSWCWPGWAGDDEEKPNIQGDPMRREMAGALAVREQFCELLH